MDPSGAGIGKAAGELLQEMQKAQAETQKAGVGQTGAPTQSFQEVMQTQQVQQPTEVQTGRDVHSATQANNVLLQAKVNATSPSTRVGEAARAQQSRMAKLMQELVDGQDKMNNLMRLALSGRQFSPSEMLAMQAGIFRFSQELELTSKVVEKATSGIKQTMSTQV